MKADTYEGHLCVTCGGTERYSSNSKCVPCKLESARRYRESRRKILSDKQSCYYYSNHDEIKAKRATYRDENRDTINAYFREYASSNRDKRNAHHARRRSALINRTPSWLTSDDFQEIRDLYLAAQMFKMYTGDSYHVDHIIPLQGETVSGLHVPSNLQVIPAKENMVKNNRFKGDVE